MAPIFTKRLLLRQFDESDLENLFSLLGSKEVSQMLPKGQVYTREETKLWLEGFKNHWEQQDFGVWAVEDRSTNEFFGYCGLRTFPEFQEVEVLYSIMPHHWGKGIASEAASASVKFGFRILQLKKIIGLTKMDNPRSSSVLLNAGLRFIEDTKVFGIECKYYETKAYLWDSHRSFQYRHGN